MRCTLCCCIRSRARPTSSSGEQHTTSLAPKSLSFADFGSRPLATTRMVMSRSVTVPIARPESSTMGTKPMSFSAINRAASFGVVMWVQHPPGASPEQRRYNRPNVLSRIRQSLALKLILASAIPSAVVLLAGLGALVAHSHRLSVRDPAMAFAELQTGAVLGTLLALTFAGMTIALAARHFLLKPIQGLSRVMARAELGEFLVRARVQSEDELGKLARSFNTMLARITDMAVADIEAKESLAKMEHDLSLQAELKAVNERLGAHVGEMELLLEVSHAISGTLDLPELLETLGRQVFARFGVSEFSIMLVDDTTHQLVVEAVAGDAARNARGTRFHLGEGITGEVAARGQTIYVENIASDPRYPHHARPGRSKGSFLAVPLKSKG